MLILMRSSKSAAYLEHQKGDALKSYNVALMTLSFLLSACAWSIISLSIGHACLIFLTSFVAGRLLLALEHVRVSLYILRREYTRPTIQEVIELEKEELLTRKYYEKDPPMNAGDRS